MSEKNITVYLYIDDEEKPIAELVPPITFKLDTTKLTDGEHQLRIISKFDQKEGLKIINFTVSNGPILHIEGLEDKEKVNGVLPLMINAYDTGKSQSFIIKGSENPRTIPVWVWVFIIIFMAWAAFYIIENFSL
ncbi:cytochrome C [Empedobacter falsenii]|uniref:cytochrome C n=1 Tax=Empedobacter falsenii TaxID=343874 RepID=UPI002574BAFC|nr:cytochrome C [Empedobacter falsenii]MDM1299991.1 cytochrome C [Empedobacter falsenii]MDM1319784.1 cytochrome C [Empedobacter falsenii]